MLVARVRRQKNLAWLAFLALAMAFHTLLFWSSRHAGFLFRPLVPTSPPRVDLEPISREKLEAMRSRAQRLVLQPKGEAVKEPPRDARYFSDRNVRVEKEQRAKHTDVLPQPGRPGSAQSQALKPEKQTRLSKFGVPYKMPRLQEAAGIAGANGADQNLVDENLPQGNENLVNSEESVFFSFYSRLYEAVAPLWMSQVKQVPFHTRVPPGEYLTVVDVVVDPNGNLLRVDFLERAGVNALDQVVEDSWRKLQRFPNPPVSLVDERGEVHTKWSFQFRMATGSGFQYSQPQRLE